TTTYTTASDAIKLYQLITQYISLPQHYHVRIYAFSETLHFAKTNARPKFAYATGNQIVVLAQFLRITQRRGSSTPSRQILTLPTRDDREQFANIALIFRRKIFQRPQNCLR